MAGRVKVNYSILSETKAKINQLCEKLHHTPSQLVDRLVEEEWERRQLPPLNGRNMGDCAEDASPTDNSTD